MDLPERWLVEKNLQGVSLAGTFPTHDFGRQMETAARFIAGGSAAPEIKCSLGGFDIHAGRFDRHHRLLTHLVEGLSSFAHAMKQSGMWDEVLVMTYAEFGHRPRENDSGGTDHGTAAPHLIFGGGACVVASMANSRHWIDWRDRTWRTGSIFAPFMPL